MASIGERKAIALGIKWTIGGAILIGGGVYSYFDPALSGLGIEWKVILAGCIMLAIGVAIVRGAFLEQNADGTAPQGAEQSGK